MDLGLSRPWKRYTFALLAIILTTAVSIGLQMMSQGRIVIMPYFLTILVVALYAGAVPAALSILMAVLTAMALWLRTIGPPSTYAFTDWLVLFIFVLTSSLMIATAERVRRAKAEKGKLLDLEREARQKAERVGRLKDEFLATLSHELRTPLNAILGWTHILRSEPLTENAAKGLEVIERNARLQTQIIEDLLDMSRIIAGKAKLEVQAVNLRTVASSAIASIQPAADGKRVRIEKQLDSGVGLVSGDAGRLQQVMWNLLSNAVKFTPEGGRITVRLQQLGDHAQLSVEDTGIGIKPEFLPYVFERFRQEDSSSTRVSHGLGLGLSISKELIELHGGIISVHSEGAGRGALFRISIPLAPVLPADDATQAPTNPNWPRRSSKALAGLHILVVEDERDARELVGMHVRGAGADVTLTGSAADAMKVFQDGRRIDVLISDIGMPHEDGYSLIQKIRALPDERGGGVPALALTAFARAEDRHRAILAGFQMHMAKPVDPFELVAAVAGLTGGAGKDR